MVGAFGGVEIALLLGVGIPIAFALLNGAGVVGRVTRLQFIRVLLAAVVLLLAGSFVVGSRHPVVGAILFWLSYAATTVGAVGRLHDLGRHGRSAANLVLPLFNIIFIGYLALKPSPPRTQQEGAASSTPAPSTTGKRL